MRLMIKFVIVFSLLLVGPTCQAQTQRVDTLQNPDSDLVRYQFITTIPRDSAMTKADRFMRRGNGTGLTASWDRVDSIIIVDSQGRTIDKLLPVINKGLSRRSSTGSTFEDRAILISNRIGSNFEDSVEVHNWEQKNILLQRTDQESALTSAPQIQVDSAADATILVRGVVPAGSVTQRLVYTHDGDKTLRVSYVLVGYDLRETDFTPIQATALQKPLLLTADRKTLYLRLKSTDKLMTIYKDGRVYSRVAVGHQLDEVNLTGLGYGDYLLEVTDLTSGQKRFHGLRIAPAG